MFKTIRSWIKKEAKTEPVLSTPSQNTKKDQQSRPSEEQTGALIYSSRTDTGLQRDHNEDSTFSLSLRLSHNNVTLPAGLFIVADGLGGHESGEVASEIAVRTVSRMLLQRLFLQFLDYPPQAPSVSIQDAIKETVDEANRLIFQDIPGGGTTLTAALILGSQLTLAQIGDSRAYWLSDEGEIRPLTRDHSLVGHLLEAGQITPEEALQHPQRNILYRALGQATPVEVDLTTLPLPGSGHLILCSDGLWGVLPPTQIASIIQTASHVTTATLELIRAANAAGGPDNISVILVRI